MTRADRRRLDDNVWHHVSRGSSLRSSLHLHEQWGVEGRSLDRTTAQNVAHVESCSTCRSAYEEIVDGTRLGCGSDVIGFHRPPVNDDPDKRVTLPP